MTSPRHIRPTGRPIVYVYARSAVEGEGTRNQIALIEDCLREHGVLAPGQTLPRHHSPELGVYVDEGVSGLSPMTGRPAGAQLLAALARSSGQGPRPTALWVSDVARLSRDAADAQSLLRAVAAHGRSVHTPRGVVTLLTMEEGQPR